MQPEIIVSATAAEEAVEMLNEIMDELEKPTGDITSDMVNKMRIYYLAEITEALKGAIVAHHDPQRRGIGNRIVVGTIDETGDGDDEDAGAAEPLEAEAGQ
jgi:hydrogenase maturation factor